MNPLPPSDRINGFRFSGSGDANRPSQPSGSPGIDGDHREEARGRPAPGVAQNVYPMPIAPVNWSGLPRTETIGLRLKLPSRRE